MTLMGVMLAAGTASAQSTGSQTVEAVVVTAKQQSTDGLAVVVKAAKDQAIVTKDYIKTQLGSTNLAQSINLVPGVSYSTEDPTGILSSDFRMHGFDGAHVSFTIDGTPVNDTGNYAVYPGEYSVGESIERITVNTGQTEVDSPTASSIGGTVNVVTRLPSTTADGQLKATGGSFNYTRLYGDVDTGAIGPTGLRSWLSANYVDAQKYKGAGDLKRWGFDGRLYQPIANDGFLSLSFTYASDRPDFYYSASPAQLAQYGRNFDYNTQWAVPTAVKGVADIVATPVGTGAVNQAGNDSNYYALHPNPVDFGSIRGQSKFNLAHNLTFTFDPSFFYTLANGGGATALSETDKRLFNSGTAPACAGGGAGVDLNGDGDCKDSVLVYSPSNTQTFRYSLNSSLIWDLDDHNRFQASYTFDYGRHRQTGEYTTINPLDGQPNDVFGARPGYGTPILTTDGSILRKRDRFSIAKLNQISLNYIGKFFDDRLHVNIGVRDPHFERDLHEFCYEYNGSSVYCDNVAVSTVATALAADNAAAVRIAGTTATNLTNLLGTTVKYGANGLANFRLPFKQTYKYDKALPNLGASFDLTPESQVYATYAQGFSAPKTDDLYVSSGDTVKPETSDQYGVGYRYHLPAFTTSVSLWGANWNNHIVQSFDPNDPTLSIDRNVGAVKLYGLDLEMGWKVSSKFNLYASAAYTHSELQNSYEVTYASGPDKGLAVALPVAGKELVLTPDVTYAVRGEYRMFDDALTLGLQTKYTGKRFISDTNDSSLKANIVTDFDAKYDMSWLAPKTFLQLNVYNMFASKYFSRVSTVANVNPIVAANTDTISGNTPFFYIGAPVSAYLTLNTKF